MDPEIEIMTLLSGLSQDGARHRKVIDISDLLPSPHLIIGS